MRRLYPSTSDVRQGAIPRDFNNPGECFDLNIGPPIDPPGCYQWEVRTNSYGQLPKSWAGAVDYGDLYNDFLGDITFIPDPEWTDLWSELTTEQQNLLSEIGCYCGNEGIQTPTLLVGPLQFPPVNALPFFWIPPPRNIPNILSVTRPTNPVIEVPGNCCTSNRSNKVLMEVVDEEIQLTMEKAKEPRKQYRSDYTDDKALLQNGFPRYCCSLDECNPTELVDKFIHFPRWLTDVYNPYGPVPQEPVGPLPVVGDIQYNRQYGELAFNFNIAVIHDGVVHNVMWDDTGKPAGATDDNLGIGSGFNEDDLTWAEVPTQPGVDHPYNEDWLNVALINIVKEGDPCADQCTELGLNVGCAPSCDAGKHEGYTMGTTYTQVSEFEGAAVSAAIAEAKLAAGTGCFVDLCYSRRLSVTEQQQQALPPNIKYEAVAAIYCKD